MSDNMTRRDTLRRSIDDNEQQLKQALGQLKDSIKAEVSVGSHVARTPYRVLAIAVGLGFVLGVWPDPERHQP